MINFRNKKSKKDIDNFVEGLSTLNPLELCATAKMLGVSLTKTPLEGEKPEMRDGKDIVNDMVLAYVRLNRRQRRNLMEIVKAAGEK